MDEWVSLHPDEFKSAEYPRQFLDEHLALAAREMADAESVVSSEGKLMHAHAACLSLAAGALALCGFRLRRGSRSHHYRLIESLQYTLGLPSEKVKELQDYRRKRARAMYERAKHVTEVEAEGALKAAAALRTAVLEWSAGRSGPE